MADLVTGEILNEALDNFGAELFKYLDNKFDEVDERFDGLDAKFDQLMRKLDAFLMGIKLEH